VTTPKKSSPARSAGVLLHPTSLPGPYGIGDLGPAAYGWLDALTRARQTWWQVLPLGPTGYGDSPYQAFSAFAGNPYLVSPEVLLQEGLLNRPDLEGAHFGQGRVDYGTVIPFKIRVLARAWENFRRGSAPALQPAFEEFSGKQAAWLDDFALFMALKDAHAGKGWHDWPTGLLLREPGTLRSAHQELAYQVGQHRFRQFLFFRQWGAVRQYARQRGIRLIGDLPIFVSADSADVWANPHLFLLDERRPWWPGCRRTTSRPRASSGATRCTTGTGCGRAASPGGWPGCAPPWRWWTWSGSTISAASSRTGRCRPGRRRRRAAAGCRRRGRNCSSGCAAPWAGCR
jgi:4-alpha-glucanotransferase